MKAHTSTASTVTGSTTAGAVAATVDARQRRRSGADGPDASCTPHDHGHHYGWVHRKNPPKHDGCG